MQRLGPLVAPDLATFSEASALLISDPRVEELSASSKLSPREITAQAAFFTSLHPRKQTPKVLVLACVGPVIPSQVEDVR